MKSWCWISLVATLGIVTQQGAFAGSDPVEEAGETSVQDLDQLKSDLENKIREVDAALAETKKKAARDAGANPAPGPLAGFGLAAGVGVVHLDRPDVSDVGVENGIVRVGTEAETKNGFWLETHYTFARGKYVVRKNEKGETVYRARALFHGPFLGVQVNDGEDFLKTVGLGYMVSFKRERDDPDDKGAFNLGLGVCNTQIQELAGGAVDGMPLPDGQESVQLKKRNVVGAMLVFSFTFL